MPKTTQIERAIESLQAKRLAIGEKARSECDALDAAIDALKAQQRTRKPKAAKRERVAPAEKAVAQTPLN